MMVAAIAPARAHSLGVSALRTPASLSCGLAARSVIGAPPGGGQRERQGMRVCFRSEDHTWSLRCSQPACRHAASARGKILIPLLIARYYLDRSSPCVERGRV